MSNYEKKVWVNGVTPLNSQNMNHIEEGVYNAHERIDELEFDKQDKLIAGEGIEISENNEISVKRAEDSIKIAYAELVNLKNTASLTPDKFYRITDYVTTTNGKINNVENLSRSAGHPFDIIVMAETENTLCETAYAVQREGDTYFSNSNLYAWQLRYCIENDINRFEWADIENGKGVIYRMIDEFGNDLPYDFKNIQFKRYKITGTTDSRQEAFIGKYYAFIGAYFVIYDNSDFKWFYTCNDIEGNDLSIQNVNSHDYGSCRYVKQLKIGQYLSDEPNYRGSQALNDIVLISPSMIVDLKFGEGSTKNTFVGNEDMTYSYFEEMCRRNIICGELSHNRCQECFQENLIGTGNSADETFHFVRTGRHFNKNIVIKMSSTIFKDRANDNIFANSVVSCNFSSFINNNDYSGLKEMQYCNIYRSYNTKLVGIGLWVANEINVLESCEIHIDNLYGCSFDFLQRVKLINSNFSPSTPLNIINMKFNTMIGSSSSPTIIDFASLIPYNLHGTRSLKRLCCAKINTGSTSNINKIEYTCENIEDGKKVVLGAYSDDNGVTWLPLAQDQDVSNTLEITSEDITVEGDKTVFSSDVAQKIMSMNKRLRIDASIADPRLEQGKFIVVFTPRAIIDYSLPEGTIVYEYSTTNWLLDTYRTTYVEFLWDATAEKLYVNANSPAKNEDHIVGFSTENIGSIGLTSNIDMRTSSINTLRINDLDTISFVTNPSLEFNANDNNELESIVFKQDGSTADFTYTIPKGAKHYVVNELPTTDIDTTGNYYVMTESEDARGYLSTDIHNLTTTEYPSSTAGALRQDATVNSSDWVQLNTSTVSSGDYMGDIAIKFNIPCDVTLLVNPRQTRLAFMYIDVNGVNVKLVNAGETYTYKRVFGVDETLCVRGASFSTNQFYYKLAIQPHTIDGKIPLSTNVDEYINFENMWFKNGGKKSYLHTVELTFDTFHKVYFNISISTNTPFTKTTLASFVEGSFLVVTGHTFSNNVYSPISRITSYNGRLRYYLGAMGTSVNPQNWNAMQGTITITDTVTEA